jgi:tuftelin-interacting protein 11
MSFSKSKGRGIHPKNPTDFGVFAGTGGLGLQLLMKMGYKQGEGLGTSGQGIVEPVQAVKRAFIGEDDGVSSRTNSSDESESDKDTPSSDKKSENFKTQGHFVQKTSRRRKRHPEISGFHEFPVSSNFNSSNPGKMTDMRPPALKSGLASRFGFTSSFCTSQGLWDLVGGLRILANKCESDVKFRKLNSVRDKNLCDELQQKRDHLRSIHATNLNFVSVCESIISLAEKNGSMLDNEKDLLSLIQECKVTPKSYPSLTMDRLACSLLYAKIGADFKNWNPISDNGILLSEVLRWKDVLQCNGIEGMQILHTELPQKTVAQRKSRIHDELDTFLWNTWIPTIRSWLQSSWIVEDPSSALHLLKVWYPKVVSPALFQYVMVHVVVPRLRLYLEDWNPSNSSIAIIPLSTWLYPWFSNFLRLEDALKLFPLLSYKLMSWFKYWNPQSIEKDKMWSMELAILQLEPWKYIWNGDQFLKFTSSHIVPKLAQFLSRSLVIDPSNQPLEPLDLTIHVWSKCLSSSCLVEVLEQGGFFTKWLDVLYQWLSCTSPLVNFSEVAEWYQTWKSYLPLGVVENPRCAPWFSAALEMMRRAMQSETIPNPVLLVQKTQVPAGSLGGFKNEASLPQHVLTFKDLVEQELIQHGLILIGTGQSEEKSGRPIHRVSRGTLGSGSINIYMDQSVVFMQEGRAWTPCNVTEVVQRFVS